MDGQAAGWGFLTHDNPYMAYVAGIFTAPDFRNRGVASALLKHMHDFSLERGLKKILLVPSFMAWNFYTKRGYQTIAHFSTFLPSDNETSRSANT
jgi:predicted GNAT family acetyltransferase